MWLKEAFKLKLLKT